MLAGGASRRFGRDKAVAVLGGRTLVQRVVAAMDGAGAEEVLLVGGRPAAARGLRVRVVPDRWPGQGPLGGVITGLGATSAPFVVVAACDLAFLGPGPIHALVDALAAAVDEAGAEVAVAASQGARHWHLLALHRSAEAPMRARFDAGERSLHRGVTGLAVIDVPVEASAVADVDVPADLDRYASGPEVPDGQKGEQ